MSAITWADVTARAPELSTLDPVVQAAILADVTVLLSVDAFGDKYTMAACALAAHLGTLSKNKGQGPSGPITSESTGRVSRSYASAPQKARDDDYSATTYGLRYLSIVATLPGRWGVL